MIYIVNKRRKLESIEAEFPNAAILDITSKSKYAQILSPFYPHYNIPIPLDSRSMTATCVEAIWQGLKVFESEGVNLATFKNDTMRNLKRTVRTFGTPRGHQNGVYGTKLLNYFDARMQIYLPIYKWVLDNILEVHSIVERIKEQSSKQDIVFLDYNTNINFRDTSSPLSHAGLVKLYIEGNYPDLNKEYKPLTKLEIEAQKKLAKEEKKNKTKRKKHTKSKKTVDEKSIESQQLSLF